jgi:ketosteroid isomerase-like protein
VNALARNVVKARRRVTSQAAGMNARKLIIAAGLLVMACDRPIETGNKLTAADRSAIMRLDSTFVQGWLRDDTTAALSIWAPDAILHPPNSAPVQGVAAIRAFWWPADGSTTKITKFERQVDEIDGSHDVAYIRGRSELGWVYTKAGKSQAQIGRSASIMIARRDSTGAWAIHRSIWNAMP